MPRQTALSRLCITAGAVMADPLLTVQIRQPSTSNSAGVREIRLEHVKYDVRRARRERINEAIIQLGIEMENLREQTESL
jgi:hypothetical protein